MIRYRVSATSVGGSPIPINFTMLSIFDIRIDREAVYNQAHAELIQKGFPRYRNLTIRRIA